MNEARPFGRVAIIGVGGVGGSLGGALRGVSPKVTVAGFSTDPSDLRIAVERGLIDCACDSAEAALEGSDLVVFAAPLKAVTSLLRSLKDALQGRMITDVVSLKAPVMRVVAECGLAAGFVGAHPLCGSADSGAGAASPNLFIERTVFLTAGGADDRTRAGVEQMWRSVGADVEWTTAEIHDSLMLDVSHLPQLLANALAADLQGRRRSLSDLGPGGSDMTRLAASSPEMWIDLFRAAGPDLASGLRALARSVESIADDLDSDDFDSVRRLMERTRKWRNEA